MTAHMHPAQEAPPARYVPKHRRRRRRLGPSIPWPRTPRRRAASILLLVSISGVIAGTAAATNSADVPARSASHPLAATLVSARYSTPYAAVSAVTSEVSDLRVASVRRVARQYRLELLRKQGQLAAMAPTVLEPKPAPEPVEAAPEAEEEAVEVVSSGADWTAIAACESGGDWSINTGNGFWGGLQFTPQTWFAFGGGPFDGVGPFPYSAATQIAVAERVLAVQGPMAWPNCFVWA